MQLCWCRRCQAWVRAQYSGTDYVRGGECRRCELWATLQLAPPSPPTKKAQA